MAEIDPHGWILTLVSVFVVFCALIILYFVYTLSGNVFSGKFSSAKTKTKQQKKSSKEPDAEIAAAIAMALEAELAGEAQAAIALALHLSLSNAVHDAEPGFITIAKRNSAWDNKEVNFRKLPTR